jgi:8-oxo-dGTP diphosphatase
MEEIWKICVCGVLRCKNKFLIVKRITDDTNESCFWEFPSGKAEFGETVEQALEREINEEVKIDIKNTEKKLIGTSEYIIEKKNQKRYTVQLNYLVNFDDFPEIELSEEHTSYEWVDKNNEKFDDFLKEIISQI